MSMVNVFFLTWMTLSNLKRILNFWALVSSCSKHYIYKFGKKVLMMFFFSVSKKFETFYIPESVWSSNYIFESMEVFLKISRIEPKLFFYQQLNKYFKYILS